MLYAIFAGFIAEDIAAIGVAADQIEPLSVSGVPVRDMAVLLALFCLILRYRQMLRVAGGRGLLLIVAIFVLGLFQGLSSYGVSRLLNYDIRIFLSFLGGIGFALALERARNARTHLTVLLLLLTVLMVISSLFSPSYYEYRLTGEAVRVAHPSLYMFAGLMTVPLVLMTNLTAASIRSKLIPALCLAACFVFGALLSSTRSNLIISAVLVLILLTSLRMHFRNGIVSIENTKGTTKLVVLSVGLMVSILLWSTVDSGRTARYSTLVNPSVLLTDARVLELAEFYASSNNSQLLLGRGVGGSITTPILGGEMTQAMHIGIINVWMKYGLLPFAIASVFLFLVIPIRYVRSFANAQRPSLQRTTSDTANIVILPSLFPWIIGLLISGGYGQGSLFFAGFTFYAYSLVKRDGVAPFFDSDRVCS